MNDTELDIQKIAEELIARMQKQSRLYTGQGERLKWMAAGAQELHEAIRSAAEKLSVTVGDIDAD